MRDTDLMLVRNVLNGVEPRDVAAAYGTTAEHVSQALTEALRLVAEYVLVHCVPFFPCQSLTDARRNHARVIEVLEAIALWDAIERDMMLDLLKGVDVMRKYGASRTVVEAQLNRTLNAVPHYLGLNEVVEYTRDRKGFLAAHRARVIEAVEKFVSFGNPLVYKRIEHQLIVPEEMHA